MGARMLPFAFEAMGMILFIGDTLEPWCSKRGNTPNVRFEFQPFSVATEGIERVQGEALRIIHALGGTGKQNMLSEIHLTADIETDRPHRASDYHTSIDGLWRKVRTRTRTQRQDDSRLEIESADFGADTASGKIKQVSIGKDKKMLRIYDKMLELLTHPDKIFESLQWDSKPHIDFLHECPDQKMPETAIMRVEFQLRRERLIERNVDTVEDYVEKRGALWKHLTEEYVTLIEDDDVNRSRCSTQQWWQVVQQAWKECPLFPLPKRAKPLPDFKKYVDQAMGLMTSMGARLGTAFHRSMTGITVAMMSEWEKTHAETWQEILRRKREELEIRWASLP